MRPGRKLLYSAVLLSAVLLILVAGCSRDEFSVTKVSMIPMIVATHGDNVRSTLSEGFMLAISAGPLAAEDQYQVSVKSPGGSYSWEFFAQPMDVGGALLLGKSDLLYPPDIPLESGNWQVEVFLSDGRRFEEALQFVRSEDLIAPVSMGIASMRPAEWATDGNGHQVLYGVDPDSDENWTYTFYDSAGILLHTLESPLMEISDGKFSDTGIQEKTASIIASRFDANLGLFYVVRTLFIT